MFHAFAITLRPHGGMIQPDIDAFAAYCESKADYYNIVTEKKGQARHIHASMYFKDKKMRKSNINLEISRLRPLLGRYQFRSQWESMKSIWSKACKILIIYNDGWENYLQKDPDVTFIKAKMPEDMDELKKLWVAKNGIPKRQTSPWFHKMERLWYEEYDEGDEIEWHTVGDFMYKHMYNTRIINVIKNDRDIRAAVTNLIRFLKRQEKIDIVHDQNQ